MTFDTTKNYAEFGNAFFRGRLKGANGVARVKLTANALYAVNTVNIAGAQITYNFYFRYQGVSVGSYGTLISAVIEVVDPDVYMEFIAYGAGARWFQVDGVNRPDYSMRGPGILVLPFNEVIPLAPGQHTVSLHTRYAVNNSDGYIFCRYIRRTGSDNL